MASENSTVTTSTDGGRRMTRERALRLALPAVGLAVAIVLLATSGDLNGGAGWYARVLVALFGVVALIGLIVEIAHYVRGEPAAPAANDREPADPDAPDEVAGAGSLLRVGIVVASVIAMLLLANVVGFWSAMAIPVIATLLILGVRTLWKVALAAVLTVAAGYVVFTILLQVRVPEGILGLL